MAVAPPGGVTENVERLSAVRGLDEAQRETAIAVLRLIEQAALAIADDHGANLRVERDRGGNFPYVTFRVYGELPRDADEQPRPSSVARVVV